MKTSKNKNNHMDDLSLITPLYTNLNKSINIKETPNNKNIKNISSNITNSLNKNETPRLNYKHSFLNKPSKNEKNSSLNSINNKKEAKFSSEKILNTYNKSSTTLLNKTSPDISLEFKYKVNLHKEPSIQNISQKFNSKNINEISEKKMKDTSPAAYELLQMIKEQAIKMKKTRTETKNNYKKYDKKINKINKIDISEKKKIKPQRLKDLSKVIKLPEYSYKSVYHLSLVDKLINNIMTNGKKAIAEKIVYGAFKLIKTKIKRNPLHIFRNVIKKHRPFVEVKAIRKRGRTYQIPKPINSHKQCITVIKWLIKTSKKRKEKSMIKRLAWELITNAHKKNRSKVKKLRIALYKKAQANRAFYRFKYKKKVKDDKKLKNKKLIKFKRLGIYKKRRKRNFKIKLNKETS